MLLMSRWPRSRERRAEAGKMTCQYSVQAQGPGLRSQEPIKRHPELAVRGGDGWRSGAHWPLASSKAVSAKSVRDSCQKMEEESS